MKQNTTNRMTVISMLEALRSAGYAVVGIKLSLLTTRPDNGGRRMKLKNGGRSGQLEKSINARSRVTHEL